MFFFTGIYREYPVVEGLHSSRKDIASMMALVQTYRVEPSMGGTRKHEAIRQSPF